jgi:hypothetical protein
MAGTLKLQDTSNAVTSLQASELLTLWEAYQSMSNSDTTSQVELDALEMQVECNMTMEQLKAIDDMHLTEGSVSELLQTAVGSSTGNSPQSTPGACSSSSSSGDASGNTGAMGGGLSSGQGAPSSSQAAAPLGVPPSGSMTSGSGGDSVRSAIIGDGTTTQSTAVATQSAGNTASAQVNPMLLQAVIQMLQSLSQASRKEGRQKQDNNEHRNSAQVAVNSHGCRIF